MSTRDPVYLAICKALKEKLDGNLFQEFAVSQLMLIHPNLVPMPGGDDEGMDGAFGTPDGPFPLICTTQESVISNFRQNMERFLVKYPLGPKRAVIATSRVLTNKKRSNLYKEAERLGVILENIYDGNYFQEQLYHDPQWRKTLLNITGRPSALSDLPKNYRQLDTELLFGRREILDWLRTINTDALIVGQPGSGKTYLHQKLAAEGTCYFVVDSNPEALADAIREHQPAVVVIDDAHSNPGLILELKRLRLQLRADYKIHANCWPSHAIQIQRELGIGRAETKLLKRLSREDIYDLIQAVGIAGPPWLLDMIINQARGKPGLAYALSKAALERSLGEVLYGEVLNRELLHNSHIVRGIKEKLVLAMFALGGENGLPRTLVSLITGISPLDLAEITASLGSGGIVEEVHQDNLCVFPDALRGLLVKEVFCQRDSAFKLPQVLAQLPRSAATNAVLLHAKQLGAEIEDDYLEEVLLQCGTADNWEHFAHTGPENSRRILQKYPARICETASALLRDHPSEVLDKLLDLIEIGTKRNDSNGSQPKRKIRDWIIARDRPASSVERRKILLAAIQDKIRKNQIASGHALAWGLTQALVLSFEEVVSSVRNKREVKFTSGVVPFSTMEEIAALWPKILELFHAIPRKQAPILLKELENWILPQRLSSRVKLPPKVYTLLGKQARVMLGDVLSMPHTNRAWKSWAKSLLRWSKLKVRVETDPHFEAIFGERHLIDWKAEQKERRVKLEALAQELLAKPIDEALGFINEIHQEALDFENKVHDGHLPELYEAIAVKTSAKNLWLDALIERRALTSHLLPFLLLLQSENLDLYLEYLQKLLEIEDYQEHAIRHILRLHPPREALLDRALKIISNENVINNFRLYDSEIDVAVMARLLSHENPRVRAMAASCEWNGEPRNAVRVELATAWKKAVLDLDRQSHDLFEIFQKHPDLAYGWLLRQFAQTNHWMSDQDIAVVEACRQLTDEQRKSLICEMTHENYSDDVFDLIVGTNHALLRDWLLSHENLEEYRRLKPLDREMNERWMKMALVALEAGITVQKLKDYSRPDPWEFDTSSLIGYQQLIPKYERLADHVDPRLAEVGRHGLNIIREKIEKLESLEEAY